jgi:hypothetical protein
MQDIVLEHSKSDSSDSIDNPYISPSKHAANKPPTNNRPNYEKVNFIS